MEAILSVLQQRSELVLKQINDEATILGNSRGNLSPAPAMKMRKAEGAGHGHDKIAAWRLPASCRGTDGAGGFVESDRAPRQARSPLRWHRPGQRGLDPRHVDH